MADMPSAKMRMLLRLICAIFLLVYYVVKSFEIAVELTQLYFRGRAFHHYQEVRNRRAALKKHPELDRLLREEYRSMDDFRHAKGKNTALREDDH